MESRTFYYFSTGFIISTRCVDHRNILDISLFLLQSDTLSQITSLLAWMKLQTRKTVKFHKMVEKEVVGRKSGPF